MRNSDARPQVYASIVGDNFLQNCLLTKFLQNELNQECGCFTNLDEFRGVVNRRKEWMHLVLCDCKNLNIPDIWQHLENGFRSGSNRFLIALFNIRRSLNIEQDAMKRGLRGVFYEDEQVESIIKGVQMILDGQLWFSRDTLSKYVKENVDLDTKMSIYPILTFRERQIIIDIVKGLSNDEIAQNLGISLHTVKTHLYNVYNKIGVSSRIQAAFWAVKNL